MDFQVKIDSKKLARLIKNAPEKLVKEVGVGLKKAALKVTNSAKSNAPYKTGHLRRSITHKVNNDLTANIGTNVVYAKVREYNTRSKPRGYLRPALKSNRNYIIRVIQSHIKRALK